MSNNAIAIRSTVFDALGVEDDDHAKFLYAEGVLALRDIETRSVFDQPLGRVSHMEAGFEVMLSG